MKTELKEIELKVIIKHDIGYDFCLMESDCEDIALAIEDMIQDYPEAAESTVVKVRVEVTKE